MQRIRIRICHFLCEEFCARHTSLLICHSPTEVLFAKFTITLKSASFPNVNKVTAIFSHCVDYIYTVCLRHFRKDYSTQLTAVADLELSMPKL